MTTNGTLRVILLIATSLTYLAALPFAVSWSLNSEWPWSYTEGAYWMMWAKLWGKHVIGVLAVALPLGFLLSLLVTKGRFRVGLAVAAPAAAAPLVYGGALGVYEGMHPVTFANGMKDLLVILFALPLTAVVLGKLALNQRVYPTHKS